jgi:UPF0755 protein
MWYTLAAFFGFLLFFSLVFIAALVFYNSPPSQLPAAGQGTRSEAHNAILFEIRKGETARSVGNRLEEAGIIRSRYFWFLLTHVQSEYIKTGTYRLELPLSQLAIHQVFVSGRQVLSRITIPEGLTLKKAARIFQENGICSEADFLDAAGDPELLSAYGIPGNTMEGYLFPDTYFFPADYPAARIITTMADTFFERLKNIEPEALAMNSAELNRRVIIASIVEREYRVPDEAPLMAGVFFNRLDIGMALQSCATVEYVITEIQGKPHPDILLNRDLEISSLYNTYIVPGLPPGPISSPGATALEAALHPQKSDYLYFRLTDAARGIHYFSRTHDDHIKAGLLYLKN